MVDLDDPRVATPRQESEYRVPVPGNLQLLKGDYPELAWAWRVATRAALAPAVDAGWAVAGMTRTSDGATAYRLLQESYYGTRADSGVPDSPPSARRP